MFKSKSLFFIFLFILCNAANGQIIRTIGGNGSVGYSGDGGPATVAGIASSKYSH